jgi:hypothetical protein
MRLEGISNEVVEAVIHGSVVIVNEMMVLSKEIGEEVIEIYLEIL